MTRIEELEREVEDAATLEAMASWELHQASNLHIAQSKARALGQLRLKTLMLVRQLNRALMEQERDAVNARSILNKPYTERAT